MAVYSVDSNGKAPKGLSANDYVVTRNGTYQIKSVNADGTYNSSLYDSAMSLSNYNGQLGSLITGANSATATPANTYNTGSSGSSGGSSNNISQAGNTMNWAGQGGTPTHSNYPGSSLNYDAANDRLIRTMPNGQQYYVNRGDEKWPALYAEYMGSKNSVYDAISDMGAVSAPEYQPADTSALEAQVAALTQQLANQQYTPVNQEDYTKNVMTYDEALAYAERLLAPKYDEAYKQTAEQAAQNLDRAGLVDSLYGQQLAMSQQNAVTNARQQAINDLAVSLVGQDRQYALQLLNAAIGENQFGASYQMEGLSTAANLSVNMINTLVDQANALNNYNLQATSLELQKQAPRIEALYTAGLMEKNEAELELLNLEIEATKAAQSAGIELTGGSGGGGGSRRSSGGGGGDEEDSTVYLPMSVGSAAATAAAAKANSQAAARFAGTSSGTPTPTPTPSSRPSLAQLWTNSRGVVDYFEALARSYKYTSDEIIAFSRTLDNSGNKTSNRTYTGTRGTM